MLAVNSMNQDLSTDESFENTYKTAYSHGLEQIYALETVDIAKVKKIEPVSASIVETVVEQTSEDPSLWDGQYELELGDEYRRWMPPLFLKEPIQMLGLSQRAEIVCLDQGILHIIDLIGVDFNEMIEIKGVGQGHIDEIQQKLRQFIAGRSIERTYYLEFASLVRSLTVGLDRKKAHLYLQAFELDQLLPLSAAERMETLNTKISDSAFIEAKQCFIAAGTEGIAEEILEQMTRAFLTPWIRLRGGVATIREVEERLERIAQEPSLVGKVILFLKETYFNHQHPFTLALTEVEPNVYCPDIYTANAFLSICKKAKGYFYNSAVSYQLKELMDFLSREFGQHWEGYPEELAVASLKRCSQFRVRKGNSGQLEVRLA